MALKYSIIVKYNRLLREVCHYYKLNVAYLGISDDGLYFATRQMLVEKVLILKKTVHLTGVNMHI